MKRAGISCMPALEDYRCFVEALESSGLPYCVTGSVAAGIYGEPRFTADIDFVLLLRVRDIAHFRTVFPEEEYYIPPIEVLAFEAARTHRGMFNLIHHRLLVKADVFLGSRDPLHVWAMEHRRRKPYLGGEIWVAPPEYVVLRKLESIREVPQDKHYRDIAYMIPVTPLDQSFFDAQLTRLGLQELWDETRAGAQEAGGESGLE